MNIWVVSAAVGLSPGEPLMSFADPGDALVWADEEFGIKNKWMWDDVEGVFLAWADVHYLMVFPLEYAG